MWLLDTNVVSETRRPDRANPSVIAWMSAQPLSTLFVSAVTVLELRLGALRLERRDPIQGERLVRWIDEQVLRAFEGRIIPVDLDVALRCAPLHVPDTRDDRDAYIAATALVTGMTIVTRNVSDFAGTGAPLLNPWEPQPSAG